MVEFNEMPESIRVPGTYVEINNLRAQSALTLDYRIVVIGQRLAAGTVAALTPTLVRTKGEAAEFFGRGSDLSIMLNTLFDNNQYTEKLVVALDNDAVAAATGSITITDDATANGTLSLYLGGVRVQVAVAEDDTPTIIGDAVDAAILLNPNLQVTSANVAGVITFTAKNKGKTGEEIDIRYNYRGKLGGEELPAGISVAISPMTSGGANPDIDTAIAVLPDEVLNYWLQPYLDSDNLDKIDAELNRRFSPTVQLEGHAFLASSGTVNTLISLGDSRNNQHVTIMDAENNSPTPSYVWAAAYCGQGAHSASLDSGRPFTTLQLIGVLASPVGDRRNYLERESLLHNGIATHTVTRVGAVEIERAITTYQENPKDLPDASYLDSQTLFNLSFERQTLIARIREKYPRHKLADDGTRFGADQPIVTPSVIKGEIIALAGEWLELGLFEDIEQFKKELIVIRDETDSTRLDSYIPSDLTSQFRVLAAQISFKL